MSTQFQKTKITNYACSTKIKYLSYLSFLFFLLFATGIICRLIKITKRTFNRKRLKTKSKSVMELRFTEKKCQSNGLIMNML